MAKEGSSRQRRFEEHVAPNPEAVKPLPPDHPALVERMPLFAGPKNVVTPAPGMRVLVSGQENRKIGRVVTKGPLRGYGIYVLTLPERMTCPSHCTMWASCYGNAMPFARRHRPGVELESAIKAELKVLMQRHPVGVLIRLHGLGDFYSPSYVGMWNALLTTYPNLVVYGYTAHGGQGADAASAAIAAKIQEVKDRHPKRFRIRWSRSDVESQSTADSTTVINRRPDHANQPEGIVCPAELDKTACCATCGMCWDTSVSTIVFMRHGLGSRKTEVLATRVGTVDGNAVRPVRRIEEFVPRATRISNAPPQLRLVDPATLLVDETYQRELSGKSMLLIEKMVAEWDWSRFKPPVVCEVTPDGADEKAPKALFVLDGQHTSIAAATHPGIPVIPVMVVEAPTVAMRAKAFLGHNRDRIAVTPGQMHRTAVVAGDPMAVEVERVAASAGIVILRNVPPAGFKPGQTVAIGAIKKAIREHGPEVAGRALKALAEAACAPVRAEFITAVSSILGGIEVAQRDEMGRYIVKAIEAGADGDVRRSAQAMGGPLAPQVAVEIMRRVDGLLNETLGATLKQIVRQMSDGDDAPKVAETEAAE